MSYRHEWRRGPYVGGNRMLIVPRRRVRVTDPFFPNVSLLLHGSGANGSTAIIDSSQTPKTITVVGNAQISTAQSPFGGSSVAFDGNGDYLSVAANTGFSYGASALTIETFAYFSASADMTIYDSLPIGGVGSRATGFVWFKAASNLLTVFSNGSFRGSSTIAVPTGQWCYIALTKSGSTWSFGINGQAAGSFTYPFNPTDNNLTIGRLGDDANYFMNGWLGEYRVTKGIARDVSVVPSAPFPDA